MAALGLPTTHDQVREIRAGWEAMANTFLARADFDMRIDHRSHLTRGVTIEPTAHVGVHATELRRRGIAVARVASMRMRSALRHRGMVGGPPSRAGRLDIAQHHPSSRDLLSISKNTTF